MRNPKSLRRPASVFGILLILVGLSGCAGQWESFGLPTPASEQAPFIGNLWMGFCIAAIVIGCSVWGLIIWAVIRYRRKDGDEKAPRQTKYHLPLELLYTLVPFLIIGVLFLYTIRASDEVLKMEGKPDLVVDVIGQKWSWTFNYHGKDDPKIGTDAHTVGTFNDIPTLYLPVNKRVQFNLESADVIHSFWVPAFYFKMDVIPGVHNKFQVTPNRIGEYDGKCAELCGEFHANMVFKVKVVSEEDYAKHVKELALNGMSGLLEMPKTTSLVLPANPQHKEGANHDN